MTIVVFGAWRDNERFNSGFSSSVYRLLNYDRVHLPLPNVADTPFIAKDTILYVYKPNKVPLR